MVFVILIFCLISGLLVPIVGLLFSGIFVGIINKQSRVLMVLFVLFLGYIFSFYLPSYTDDMTRYIGYMNSISNYSFLDFFKQLFSSNSVIIYGLNGQQWPGSAVLLFIVQKIGTYRVLSSLTLMFTYFVRLKFLQDSWIDSKKLGYYIPWFFVTILWVRPLLPLSGFRWFLSTSCIILSLSFENRYGFKKRYFIFYLLAALFHPGSIIFISLRYISYLLSLDNKKFIVLFFVFVLSLIVLQNQFVLSYIKQLFTSFSMYSDNEWNSFQLISRVLSICLMILLLVTSFAILKQNRTTVYEKQLFRYLNLLIIFNLLLIWHPSFNRLSQFTIVIGLLFVSKSYFNKDKLKYLDVLLPIAAGLIGLILMFYYPGTSFPNLTEPLMKILFFSIHFN